MWFLFLILFQDPQTMEPEAINGRVYLPSGKSMDLADIRIQGARPYTFEFRTAGESHFVSLLRVVRLTRLEDSKTFELMMDDGQVHRGQMISFSIVGRPLQEDSGPNMVVTGSLTAETKAQEVISVYNLDRLHIISGNQLRSCLKGHYEEYTPYPFCPVCGDQLAIGPFMDEIVDQQRPLPRFHRLRLDPRDPATTPGRRQ